MMYMLINVFKDKQIKFCKNLSSKIKFLFLKGQSEDRNFFYFFKKLLLSGKNKNQK